VQDNNVMDELFAFGNAITIDLKAQTILANDKTYTFDIDGERKRRLTNGLDDIDLTLQYAKEIKNF
jgi:3-isopropylmalate/(R)-2-methylmalate dehydratase small subunit